MPVTMCWCILKVCIYTTLYVHIQCIGTLMPLLYVPGGWAYICMVFTWNKLIFPGVSTCESMLGWLPFKCHYYIWIPHMITLSYTLDGFTIHTMVVITANLTFKPRMLQPLASTLLLS